MFYCSETDYKVGALLASKRTGGWLQKGREISILTVEYSMQKIRVYSTTANAYIAGKAANLMSSVAFNLLEGVS